MATFDIKEYIPKYIRRIRRVPYATQIISLEEARDNEVVPLKIPADTLSIIGLNIGTNTRCYFRLNHDDADLIPIEGVGQEISTYEMGGMPLKIHRIYVTNDAYSGGYVLLGLGGEASVKLTVGQTVVVQKFDTLLSLTEDIKTLLSGELQVAATGNDLSSVLASTDTALAAGASWTSGWITVDRYGTLAFTLVTDVQIDVTIEWSWDASVVDASQTDTVPAASSPYGATTPVIAPYARFRLTNSDTVDQTTMRFRIGGRVI